MTATYNMSIRSLSRDLQIKSEAELNEKPGRLEEDLKHILEWLAQQPHLNARTDEQWLLSFLRGCKFSLQKTKEKLDMFYTMRTMVPELFSNRDPFLPEIQEVLKLGLILPFSKTVDTVGPRIVFLCCGPADPSKVHFVTVLKTSLMIIDMLMNEDDNFVIAGQHAFLDLKGLSLNHVLQITPNICRKIMICLQNAYPTRPKGFHFINMPAIFERVFNIVKPLATEKLQNRLYIYSENNLKNLYKDIPRSVLPKDYGGEGDSLHELTVHWKKKVESYRDWFLEDAKYFSNERMRPGKPYNSNEVFGVEGSFRKLDID